MLHKSKRQREIGGRGEEAFKSKAVNPRFWVETNGLESLLSLQGLLGRGQEFPICGDSPSVESKRTRICLAGSGLRRVLGQMGTFIIAETEAYKNTSSTLTLRNLWKLL